MQTCTRERSGQQAVSAWVVEGRNHLPMFVLECSIITLSFTYQCRIPSIPTGDERLSILPLTNPTTKGVSRANLYRLLLSISIAGTQLHMKELILMCSAYSYNQFPRLRCAEEDSPHDRPLRPRLVRVC